MIDTEMLNEYIKVRNLNQEKYLKLSKINANLLLALKNLFNAESLNINLLVDKMNEYLDNRWQIECCRNAVMRMNQNIYFCEKVGVTNESTRTNN